MTSNPPIHIADVVRQHAEEAASIRMLRSRLLWAPQVSLRDLERFDIRMEAHLDGLAVAGAASWPYCAALLESADRGAVFIATTVSLRAGEQWRLESLAALALADAEAQRGFTSALGWAPAEQLRGVVRQLLTGRTPAERQMGLAACLMHRTDPGLSRSAFVSDAEPVVRARAIRMLGELGRIDLLSYCVDACTEETAELRYWAARSALLLGARDKSLNVLEELSLGSGPWSKPALYCFLLAADLQRGHALLRLVANRPDSAQLLVWGAGLVGDPGYVSWLIQQLNDPQLSRLAGESISLITGADLSALGLTRKSPAPSPEPSDDDRNVPDLKCPEDEDLPWPEPAKMQAWWEGVSGSFLSGGRYFMGQPQNRQNCLQVLKVGLQRQRIAGAYHLCLFEPGTPLFEWRAPAWRQQHGLAQLS